MSTAFATRGARSTISIIGTGNMARSFAAELGANGTSATVGQAPAGEIVVLAVPFDTAELLRRAGTPD